MTVARALVVATASRALLMAMASRALPMAHGYSGKGSLVTTVAREEEVSDLKVVINRRRMAIF